jgi:hypothetical protein
MAGNLRQFVLTLDGTIQNLGTAFPADATTPFKAFYFTQQGAAATYIGEAGKGVSSTNYALVAPASAAAPQAQLSAVNAPPLRLRDIEVLGTNTQKLSIAGILY